tara:strand:+ start:150 stop:1442 length:1293 start_codon:yes stop_codon:yes gene_type:complete
LKNHVIQIESLSKKYRLGIISTGTLVRDIASMYSRYFGKEDPNSVIMDFNGTKQLSNREVWALKDINLNVQQGEILGIIGKNGAGKSTLLKILSRITSPTKGIAKIRGRLASLLEVGTGFHPELTGIENIFLNGAILGMSREEIRNKLDKIIDFSEIEEYINTPVKRYSSGMKVRLAFSVAAYLEPEILLIDEVLAVGDASFQDKCLNKMNSISKTGRTILFVSHQLNWVNELCTRCISIENGEISNDGDPKIVIENYLKMDHHKYTKGTLSLSGAQNEYNTGSLKISKIELIGENGKPKNEFYFEEYITVKLLIDVKSRLRNCNISVMIGDLRGKIILFSHSGSIGSFKGKITKGKHESLTRLKSNMLPGVFSLYIGVGLESGQSLEWLERIFDFKILKIGRNPDSNYHFDTVHGYVNDNSIWEIKKAN